MIIAPFIASELARQRQRDHLARADHHRLTRRIHTRRDTPPPRHIH